MPRDRERWLRQMAQMLARIHALDSDGRRFESWLDAGRLSPPADASRADIWREAIALVAEPRAPTRTCFIHRDYQHFNLLWSRERLTGVVDWGGAGVGPPDVDVGHCRLNLTLLFSADVAERFREMYEAESGRTVDPWWDVHALLSYGPDWKNFLPTSDRRPRAARRGRDDAPDGGSARAGAAPDVSVVDLSHEQHDLREPLLDEPAAGPPAQLHLLPRAIDDDEPVGVGARARPEHDNSSSGMLAAPGLQ